VGWASAGSIFDTVADGLIEANAADDIKEKVLGTLCTALQDEDWDTEDESLERYADDPVIVRVFADRGVSLARDDE